MNYGFTPDIFSTAKGLAGGLPLGATVMGEKVENTLSPSSHGSTFGGNPVCCAAAKSIINRIDEKLLGEVKEKSKYIIDTLSAAEGVKSVTGLGFMLAMVIFSVARSRLEGADIPKSLQGLPITLVSASLVSMSFLGFTGLVDGIFG